MVQPGDCALDDPAGTATPGAVGGLPGGGLRLHLSLPAQAPVLVVVVAADGGQTVGAAAGAADLAAYGWHAVDEWDQLGDVVAVAAGERPGERNPTRVDEEVMLGAGSSAINRARPRLEAPFFACTWLESATARDHSISPAARNRSSSSACSFSQTPA